jgi:hypothetical protein
LQIAIASRVIKLSITVLSPEHQILNFESKQPSQQV